MRGAICCVLFVTKQVLGYDEVTGGLGVEVGIQSSRIVWKSGQSGPTLTLHILWVTVKDANATCFCPYVTMPPGTSYNMSPAAGICQRSLWFCNNSPRMHPKPQILYDLRIQPLSACFVTLTSRFVSRAVVNLPPCSSRESGGKEVVKYVSLVHLTHWSFIWLKLMQITIYGGSHADCAGRADSL